MRAMSSVLPAGTMAITLVLVLLSYSAAAVKPALQKRVWGTNIHFTTQMPGELAQLGAAFRVARMDYGWATIEQSKGQYNFSAYDKLLADCKTNNIQPLWILDYGNALYTGDSQTAPATPEAQAAFANYAVASISHFKGNNIIWELYNEPNIPGKGAGRKVSTSNGGSLKAWIPYANATAYASLYAALRKALDARPDLDNETLVAPALAGVDMNFLETTFQQGMLNKLDGVSLHPYRSTVPESVVDDYAAVRALIQKYLPQGQPFPAVLSGEWGYSTCVNSSGTPIWCNGGASSGINTEETQAKFLARQWMINAMESIPVSIWYDWLDDGSDPTQGENNFGTVHNQYNNASLPYVPKLAYYAAKTINGLLGDKPFSQRYAASNITSSGKPTVDNQTYALGFGDDALAVWKTSGATGCPYIPRDTPADCGYYGISQQECFQRGCCFQLPYVGHTPQCFFPVVMNTTSAVQVTGIPASTCYKVTDYLGNSRSSQVCSDNSGSINMIASDEPLYLQRV